MNHHMADTVMHHSEGKMRHPFIPPQVQDNETMLRLWLEGKVGYARRAYAADAGAFLAHVGCSLRTMTVWEHPGIQRQKRAVSGEVGP